MAVKVVMLNTREDVITDVLELSVPEGDDQQKVIGYRMQKPCQIWMHFENIPTTPGDDSQLGHLKLKPFSQLSADESIDIKVDDVLAIVEPIPQAKNLYEKYVVGNTIPTNKTDDQTNSTDESTDSDQSN
tara:strand:+ start:45 stop:434 length:390 start_codon:yes stop_codon:yes gene_type:complete